MCLMYGGRRVELTSQGFLCALLGAAFYELQALAHWLLIRKTQTSCLVKMEGSSKGEILLPKS